MKLIDKIRFLLRGTGRDAGTSSAKGVKPRPTGSVPYHVAIIMDGNGRWASRRGLPVGMGHRAGTQAVRRVVEACRDLGVKQTHPLLLLDRELAPLDRRRCRA